MTPGEVNTILRRTGALLEGHFILRSGFHSRTYVQMAKALQWMPVTENLATALVEKIGLIQPRVVLSPALGGLVIGQEVARQLGTRFNFLEKDPGYGLMVFRRGFTLNEGESVLVVDDVITQGGRVKETLNVIQKARAIPVGIAVIIDRSSEDLNLGYPLFSLVQMSLEKFSRDQLPVDLQAIEAVHPGS